MIESAISNSIKIAIVGMTGSGKTVLITTLAMKMAQMALEDVYLAPFGDNRRETLRYTQSNWQTLNSGQWPPSTPAGELIELQWELSTKNAQATVQFLDCAGQDIRSLFSNDIINPASLDGDLKRVFDSVNSANVLIFLVNMKDLLATSDATSEILDLDQMLHVLQQRNDIPRRIAVAFSQYDKYKPEVDQRFNGDFLEYVRHNLPYLYGQYKRFHSFELIPVAAVNDTQSVVENGEVRQYPVPFFSSYNLETLIHWIADSVEELAALKNQPSPSNTPATNKNAYRKPAGKSKISTSKKNSPFLWITIPIALIITIIAICCICYYKSEAEAAKLCKQAVSLKSEKKYDDALIKINAARALSPDNYEYYQEQRAIKGLIADQKQRATKSLMAEPGSKDEASPSQNYSANQTDANDLYKQAVSLRDQKKYDEALAKINEALELRPGDTGFKNEKQKIDDLIAQSKRQDQANQLYKQAVSLRDQKKYDEALAKINEALELRPGDTGFKNEKQKIDDLIAQSKRQDQANQLYKQAISLRDEKKYDEALAKINEALILFPENVKLQDVKKSLSSANAELNRQKIAEGLYKQAVSFRNQKKYGEALMNINEALKMYPENNAYKNEKETIDFIIEAQNQTLSEPGIKAGERRAFYLKGVEFAFRWCPAGTFKMDNYSGYKVILTKGFWMQETEVTQKQWKAVMGNNPSEYNIGDNLPVNNVSWNDCQKFCKKFAQLGFPLQLPTEAQWEYSCRAGSTTAYFWGNALNGDKANCNGTEPFGTEVKGKYLEKMTPVKSYSPNSWGLYDMHGNVREWCQDWYDSYPSGGYLRNPTGPSSGIKRVIRGGYFHDEAEACTSYYRYGADEPDEQFYGNGFRCIVMDGAKAPETQPGIFDAEDEEPTDDDMADLFGDDDDAEDEDDDTTDMFDEADDADEDDADDVFDF